MKDYKTILTNLCRMVLAVVCIFSGYVKAIDPLGTQYKIQDYLGALHLEGTLPDWLTLAASVGLSALEFCMGILLLFAIRRRQTSKVALVFMGAMTAVTLWLALANPIKDCGCFGDAVHLTNWQTLGKNLMLLAAAIVLWKWPLRMRRFISRSNQWIVTNYTLVFILATSAWCLYNLPLFDFRPYHVGADLRKGMEIPAGAKQPKFETTFIMEKDGEQKEFALEDYPDSTWTFIDAKTIQTEAGYEPPIHDFNIVENGTGEDITEQVLNDKGYTFLLISPHLEHADDICFGDVNRIHEYAEDNGHKFYCLTASSGKAIRHWSDITGAEYPFCTTDATTLKTIIRSNPGLVLIKQGKVIRKWSHNALPPASAFTRDGSELGQTLPLGQLAVGKLPEDRVSMKLAAIATWFLLPLLLLTLADRLWAWTRWVRIGQRRKARKEKAQSEAETTGKETENEDP